VYKYSADHLAVMSTILACATGSRSWATLGVAGNPVQEEVQMMRVDDQLFIACNGNGHTLIANFFDRFGVRDEASFIESLKWTHCIAKAVQPNYKKWHHNVAQRITYSAQEQNTIGGFRMPPGIPAVAAPGDLTTIYDCVGKPGNHDPAPQTPNDWKAARFYHLLGAYNKVPNPAPAPPNAANYTTRTHAQDYIHAAITLIGDTTPQVHAEMKLLAYLAKMVVDRDITTREVHLGGLKNACVSCNGWIKTFSSWLWDHKEIKLRLPRNDARPHANPVNWAIPKAAQSVKDRTAELLPNRFA
jgi:hypothetical protein